MAAKKKLTMNQKAAIKDIAEIDDGLDLLRKNWLDAKPKDMS